MPTNCNSKQNNFIILKELYKIIWQFAKDYITLRCKNKVTNINLKIKTEIICAEL